jgi:methionyl-tRNA formyltransferase
MTREKVLFLGPGDSPLVEWLRDHGEDVVQTDAKLSADALAEEGLTFLVSYGYRHILRRPILDMFPDRAINLHISYLPWNRGADPNLWSFVEHTPKGVTIHRIDEGIDTGDVLVQEEVDLDPATETLATSYTRLQEAIQGLFMRNWSLIKSGRLAATPQPAGGSTHRSTDKNALSALLSNGWDTPVSALVDSEGSGPAGKRAT